MTSPGFPCESGQPEWTSDRAAMARIPVVNTASPSETTSLPRRERARRTSTGHAVASPSLGGRRPVQKELVGTSNSLNLAVEARGARLIALLGSD